MDSFIQMTDGDIVVDDSGRFWMYAQPFSGYPRALLLITDPDDDGDLGVDPKTGAWTVIIQNHDGVWTIGIQPPLPAAIIRFGATIDRPLGFTGKRRANWRAHRGVPRPEGSRADNFVTPAAAPPAIACGGCGTISLEQVENDVEDAQVDTTFRQIMSDSDIQL